MTAWIKAQPWTLRPYLSIRADEIVKIAIRDEDPYLIAATLRGDPDPIDIGYTHDLEQAIKACNQITSWLQDPKAILNIEPLLRSEPKTE